MGLRVSVSPDEEKKAVLLLWDLGVCFFESFQV